MYPKRRNSYSVSYSMYAHGVKKEKNIYSADGKADITSLATITYMKAVPELVEKGSRELVDKSYIVYKLYIFDKVRCLLFQKTIINYFLGKIVLQVFKRSSYANLDYK